jgi:hypothetical protein
MENKMNQNLIRLGLLMLVISALSLLLTACGHDQPRKPLDDVVLVPKNETVNVPAKTLEPCKKLPRMEDRPYTQKDALSYMGKLMDPVADCKERQKDATDTLKKAFNTETSK